MPLGLYRTRKWKILDRRSTAAGNPPSWVCRSRCSSASARRGPLVSDLVKLRRDSVISLDSRIDDPVEVYIGDRLIARGELQEMEDQEGQLGVRLTEVADLSNAV